MKQFSWFWILFVTVLGISVVSVRGQNSNSENSKSSQGIRSVVTDSIIVQTSSIGRQTDAQLPDTSNLSSRDSILVEKDQKQPDPLQTLFEDVKDSPELKAWQERKILEYEKIKNLKVKDSYIRSKVKEVRDNPRPYLLPSYPGSENSSYFYYRYAPDHRSVRIPLRLSTKSLAVSFLANPADSLIDLINAEGLNFPEFIAKDFREALKTAEAFRGPHDFVFVQSTHEQSAENMLMLAARLRNLPGIKRVSEVFYRPEDTVEKNPLIPQDQITVVFRDGATPTQINALSRELGTKVVEEYKGIYKIKVMAGGGISSLQVAEQYRQNLLVALARPDFFEKSELSQAQPSDPFDWRTMAFE